MEIREPIRTSIRRLHRDRSGATLTEFVIVLPVFLILFAGIMKMTLLQSSTVQVKMAATGQLWERALSVQKNETAANRTVPNSPSDGAGRSTGIISDSDVTRTFSDEMDREMNDGLQNDGLTGRAHAAVSEDQFGEAIVDRADLRDLPPSTGPQPEPSARDVVIRGGTDAPNYTTRSGTGQQQIWTEALVDDTSADSEPPNGPPPVDNLNVATDSDPSVPAFAAGIRYGLVRSDKHVEQSVIDRLPTYSSVDELRTGYHTLVAPTPIRDVSGSGSSEPPQFRPTGMARRFMEKYPNELSEIRGIEQFNRYAP